MSPRKRHGEVDDDTEVAADESGAASDEVPHEDRRWDSEEFEILRCAFIYSNYERLSQREVADYLGVSPATVTRRLNEARERGWLVESVAFRPPPYAEQMRQFFGSPEVQHRVTELLEREDPGNCLRRVDVVPIAGTPSRSRERCARIAARFLEDALREGKQVLACNWGRTTEAIARALRPATVNAELEVIPIFGDLGVDPREKEFAEAHKYCANQVAEHIAERFGGRVPARLTFKAFIPPNIGPQELEVIRRYVRSDWSYQIVFGVEDDEGKLLKEGRIHQAGTILSGLGAVEHTNAWIQYARTVTDTDLRQMGKHIVGDIAQRFVTIEGVDAPLPRELQAVAVMNSRVTGLSPRHFQALARRHADGELPGLGVVIVAGGADKAAVTLAAVRSSAVNHLIVGEDLAAALLRLKL